MQWVGAMRPHNTMGTTKLVPVVIFTCDLKFITFLFTMKKKKKTEFIIVKSNADYFQKSKNISSCPKKN